MKKRFTILFLIVCYTLTILQAQNLRPVAQKIADAKNSNNAVFRKTAPFTRNSTAAFAATVNAFAKNPVITKMSMDNMHLLFAEKNANIELTFPYKDGSEITLELVQVNIFAENFAVVTSASDGHPVEYTPGIYYQGTIKDDPNSIAAISIFENEIMGIVSSAGVGNINIGRYKAMQAEADDYIIFSDAELNVASETGCATIDDESYMDAFHELFNNPGGSRITNCPKIYLEADNGLYINKGSVTNTTNYLTGIFNNSSTIYANETVPIQLSTIFVWTTADGYATSSSSAALTSFKSFRTTFSGDIAQLCALDPGGLGGVAATINGLCNSNKYCYSDIDATYSDFPTYSWTVMVFTHEMGHLFGSYHTHNCSAWSGGALDNCYTTEGGCSPGPAPVGGGTIMSYCHLTGYGINFTNGFGLQPGNAIRSTISAAACITSCTGGGPAYCASNGSSTADEWIQSITMAGTTNISGNNSGYGNYTGTTINLTTGGTASFTLTPGYTGTVYPEYFSIWIDFNKDLDFLDAGENVYNSGAVTGAVSSSFSVPAALTGTTRMRISMKYNALATPCEVFSYGEVEDYTANFTGGGVTYCTSAGTNAGYEWIDYYKFNAITRSSGSDAGYYNGTALSTNVNKGSTYTLSFSAGFSSTIYKEYWKAWIDYNHDGDFTDAGEEVLSKTATSSATFTKNITIPATATTATTRMRISMKYTAYAGSCETFTYGEVEDYTINILPASVAPDEAAVITISPNPSHGVFNLNWSNAGSSGVLVEIIDITGTVIQSQVILSENGETQMDITSVPAGIYIVKTSYAGQKSMIQKIIKE